MNIKKVILLCAVIVLICLSLTGCVPGDGTYSDIHTAGLFSGIWHGWIAPFSLVCSFFNKEIRIYEIYNKGIIYDFGYYIAIISGFGGLSLIRRKKKGKSSED